MTDNEKKKIALYAGIPILKIYRDEADNIAQLPKYSTDAEAIGLLNVLAEKGYVFSLYSSKEAAFSCCIWKAEEYKFNNPVGEKEDSTTIHEAITSAVIQVIEKEAQDEHGTR